MKIKVGVLGCAKIAKNHVLPNMINSGLFQIVAVSSRSEFKALEFSKLFSCEPLIGYENLIVREDLDAIYIPLPTGLHFEWIMKSLNAGKHVFVEKSLTCDFKQTQKVIETARNKKLCVFENFMFPYHSQFNFVKKVINNDDIGELRLLRSSFGFPVFDIESNIRYKKHLGGGSLLDAGAYTLMAVQLFLGYQQKVLSSSLFNDKWEVDFHGSAMLRNENNIISQIAFGFSNFYQNNIELWGSKGKIIVERAFTAGPDFNPIVTIEKQGLYTKHSLSIDNHFINILGKFHDSILQGDYSFQYEQILNQSRLLTDVRESINQ